MPFLEDSQTFYKKTIDFFTRYDILYIGISTRKTGVLINVKSVHHEEEQPMKLVPLGDRVVLKHLVAEETTKSGIILPGSAKEKPQEAEVIAVGPGGVIDGKEVVMQVQVGQKVIYSTYAGTEVKADGQEFVVVRQNDILVIVED